jgi:hypothetical protein
MNRLHGRRHRFQKGENFTQQRTMLTALFKRLGGFPYG